MKQMVSAHLWELPTFDRMYDIPRGEDEAMKWQDMKKETEPDKKNRVSLGPAVHTPEGVRYRVLKNELGQILLDPVKTVPAHEAWLWEKKERIGSVKRGIKQAEEGKVVAIDLSAYADDEEE